MADETLESKNEYLGYYKHIRTYMHGYNNLNCSEKNIKVQLFGIQFASFEGYIYL